LAFDFAAAAIPKPTELGEEDSAVALLQAKLLGVWIAEALGLALLFESWEVCATLEEVTVGAVQILQSVLKGMDWSVRKPWRLSTPSGEQLRHWNVSEMLLAHLAAFLLECQRLVEDEAPATGEPAHLPLLFAIRHEFEFVSLKPLHPSTSMRGKPNVY
jgi:hypothetical protein